METNFEPELKGTSNEATTAKQEIAKYFKRYGDSGHQEAIKHQLVFASKIMCAISKCENKHLDIYCNIITEIFADRLFPESSAKYWTLYVNCMRYFLHSLVCRNSLKTQNEEQALSEATLVVENLTKLFYDILDTNKKQNFQYPDILKTTTSWLFPQYKGVTVYQFLKNLPTAKVKGMFSALFRLYGNQIIDGPFNEDVVQEHANFIMELVNIFLQVDILDKMKLQLSIQLMDHCLTECRLKTNKPITESLTLLYDYLKLLCAQKCTLDFQRIYNTHCARFKELFENYSKHVTNQAWFGSFLVFIFYLHSQLQNQTIFAGFWKQMCKLDCFKAMFQLFVELMKLAPCISADSKLFTINCCTSVRKHVILSFAQISLAAFVFYCQNVSFEDENQHDVENDDSNHRDYYEEMIKNNLLLIINHAFKIIDKMDCITNNSPDIDIILTRFKQVTLSCRTRKQADTCISILELFLKIKTKIPSQEWPLLLRRLYKTVTQHMIDNPHIGREIQMCYISSMLRDNGNQIDVNQIRTQISIFYATDTSSANKSEQQQNCLLHLLHTSSSLLRPHLGPSRKRLLHWLESQYILKYLKANTTLLHSILKNSQSHYDFILVTKLGKLQTYAMAKIASLYKTLKSKESDSIVLTRLENLTLGHICLILVNDMNVKLQIDSKELSEEQLEYLLKREEMSSITINNDLKRFKLVWEGFKAFEDFYEKFDSETISMDDAIIDWESYLDDLASIAICLQLSGYMEHSSQAWMLHYKCSRLIQDDYSALRGLSFFCEYSEHYERNVNNDKFNLEKEIQNNFPALIYGLEKLANLQRQAHQSYILLATLQIAYYYARSARFTFAQMLLQYVEEKHAELTDRQGRYDIVMATMDIIKFRLLWKSFNDTKSAMEEKTLRTTAEKVLLHRCLLHEVEETLDRFHNFSYISSCDGLLYAVLLINFVQELAECSVNRLCDNFITPVFIAACKCTLMLGLALRFVHVMSMWMWLNLQMEYVDKAQIKLKLIEYIIGMKSLKELPVKCSNSPTDIRSSTLLPIVCSQLLTPNKNNPGIEAIRKLVEVELSPINTDKLQLCPSYQNLDLKRYFKCNIETKLLPSNEQVEWTFFIVGCLNARLYFLVQHYDQLESFYEGGSKWLQMRQNCFNKNYHKNIQLMALQHYANFLRVRQQYDKALQCLQYGLDLCENNNFYIDAVYSVNFQLQYLATQKEITLSKESKFKLPTHSKLRRALEFNISPENKQLRTPAKSAIKVKISKSEMASGKKKSADGGCASSRKVKYQANVGLSAELTSATPKTKFKICEDSFNVIKITESGDNVIATDVKALKRTKIVDENEQMYKTPKVARNPIRITKSTATKSSIKVKRPEKISQCHINIDLTDSFSSSPMKSLNTNSNDTVEKMQNLDIKPKTLSTEIETKKTKGLTKQNLIKESPPIIVVLDDSFCTVDPEELELAGKSKSNKTSASSKNKYPNLEPSTVANLISNRTRKQKKLMLDSDDKPNGQNATPSTTRVTPIITRRRQKNLL